MIAMKILVILSGTFDKLNGRIFKRNIDGIIVSNALDGDNLYKTQAKSA